MFRPTNGKGNSVSDMANTPGTGLWQKVPILLILATALIGAFTLREHLSFDALAAHRATLLAFRDAHYAASVALFIAAYAVMMALSLPGALVATLTGGFLFGLFPGVLYNVTGATIGAVAVFLAARSGFGAALNDRIAAGGGGGAHG